MVYDTLDEYIHLYNVFITDKSIGYGVIVRWPHSWNRIFYGFHRDGEHLENHKTRFGSLRNRLRNAVAVPTGSC